MEPSTDSPQMEMQVRDCDIDRAFGEGAAEALRGEVGEAGRFGARRASTVRKTRQVLVQFRDSDAIAI